MTHLEDEKLRLRSPEPEDLALLYSWENDTSLWHTGYTLMPYSRYYLKNYIAECDKDIYESKQMRLMICEKKEDKTVGTIDLFNFRPQLGKAEVGIFLSKDSQGKGYASRALQLLQTYAFDFLRLHQLYAYAGVSNDASLALFKSNGFHICGTLKDWLYADNAYSDAHIMQKINPKDVE